MARHLAAEPVVEPSPIDWGQTDGVIDPTQHPRPSLRRPFSSLDGPWEFSLDTDGDHHDPSTVRFERTIEVPFAPETAASGIGTTDPVGRCWYRRSLDLGETDRDRRHIVHFGGVDRIAVVWANGARVGSHVGGSTPFEVDITEAARSDDGHVDLVVEVDDDPRDLDAPRGKQDWQDEPHIIWYPRTTGICRSVFTERRNRTHVREVQTVGDPEAMTLDVRVQVSGPLPAGLAAHVRITGASTGRVLADERLLVTRPDLRRTVQIGDGGIDDRWGLAWWPISPQLLHLEVGLETSDGQLVDTVESTGALRSVAIRDQRFCVNGRPYPLRLVLDQGYWPETGATPPSSGSLRDDLELARQLGFNGVRKHQKIEDPRFFAWADRLGMLTWVEMPSAYRAGPRSAAALLHEWTDVIAAHRSHPSVVSWVPINESWGVDAVGTDPQQQALVRSLAGICDALDGTRPVSANDGWQTIGGDIVGIHDYDQDADQLRQRYGSRAAIDALLAGTRPDGLAADVERAPLGHRAPMLTEFGGIAMSGDTDGAAWGYGDVRDTDALVARYRELWAAVHDSDVLAGACWTQLTDTYQEVNGLATFDRRPKAPLDQLHAATRGAPISSG